MAIRVPDTIYEVEYNGEVMELPTYVYSHNGQRDYTNYKGVGRKDKVTAEVVDETVYSQDGEGNIQRAHLLIRMPDVEQYVMCVYDPAAFGDGTTSLQHSAEFILKLVE